jgi:hypothetical protein
MLAAIARGLAAVVAETSRNTAVSFGYLPAWIKLAFIRAKRRVYEDRFQTRRCGR